MFPLHGLLGSDNEFFVSKVRRQAATANEWLRETWENWALIDAESNRL